MTTQLRPTKALLSIGVTAILLTALGILIFAPQRLRAQESIECAADITVQPGDTLSAIAGRTLGNLAAYQLIVTATNAKAATDISYATIANANQLVVGWKLCIPRPQESW